MSPRIPVFTPTELAGDALREVTVGRARLVGQLSDRLTEVARSDARPHTLIVGPWGSGKTHLIALALYLARLDADTAARLAVAQPSEDAVGIVSYADLLVEICRALDPARTPQAQQLRRSGSPVALEQLLLATAGQRPILLVVENLDRVFRAIGADGQAALRGFIETSGQLAVLASMPVLADSVAKRSQPWFGAFAVDHLTELPVDEGTELLTRFARAAGNEELAAFLEEPRGRHRVAALAQLAGSTPRLWHLLSGLITVDALDRLVPAVRSLLDELTPHYRQRLWELAGVEQRLIVELARAGGGVTVTELAERSGTDRATVTPTLHRLAADGWVRGGKWPGTDQRATYYEIGEPLLRHYLLYRDSHGDLLDLIVEVLKVWCDTHHRIGDERDTLELLAGMTPADRDASAFVILIQQRFPARDAELLDLMGSRAGPVARQVLAAVHGDGPALASLPSELRRLIQPSHL